MTDEQIYRYLCGDIEVGDMYLSPIPSSHRKPDTNNSFGLYTREDGIIRWKDYGLADQEGNKAINLYQYMMGFSLDAAGYFKAKAHAESEVGKYYKGKNVELRKGKSLHKKDLCPYVEYDDNYSDFELAYWNRFSLGAKDLSAEYIYSLKSLKWLSYGKEVKSEPGDPAFLYLFGKNPISWKVYRPLSKDQKFRQWNIDGVIEGMSTFTPCDILLFLSSTKDRLVVKKALNDQHYGYLNSTSENSFVNLIARKTEFVADRLISLYDADDAGYNASTKISEYLNCEMVDMRGLLDGQKDFSDYIDKQRGNHSYEELGNLIKSII